MYVKFLLRILKIRTRLVLFWEKGPVGDKYKFIRLFNFPRYTHQIMLQIINKAYNHHIIHYIKIAFTLKKKKLIAIIAIRKYYRNVTLSKIIYEKIAN